MSHTKENIFTQGFKVSSSILRFEPVDVIFGRVLYEGIDFSLPGTIPLLWKRIWYSDSQYNGLLGHGAHSCFDMKIQPFIDYNTIGVLLNDGRVAGFEYLFPDESDFNREEQLTLFHCGDHYQLFDHNERLYYIFPIERNQKEYRLSEIRNEAGYRIECKFRHGFLYEIIDSAGRRLQISSDKKNRITKVELYVSYEKRETLVEYGYNENGDMCAITDALGKTTRIVYQNHLMTGKTDRNGQTFYWEYDGTKPKSRCTHTWGDGGLQEGRIEYHKGYNLVTDSLGNVTRYDFLPDGRVTAVTDPLGAATLTDYTPEGDVLREIDPEGNITGYSYNEFGQLAGIVYPDGSRSYNTYYPDGRLQSEVTPEGASTIYTYNESGLLERSISPNNLVTQYIYNEQNLVSEIKISDGREIKLNYDQQLNLTEALLPGGMRSEWKYDYRGQVVESNTPTGLKNSFAYDVLGRVIKTTSPDGNTVHLTYNAYEEVVRAEDRERKVEFSYTPLGSLKVRKENGHSLAFSYNTAEQLTGLRNEANERYRFGRDRAGRIVQETGFDGLTRTYKRDPNGLVRRVERPGDRWSEYVYDSMGRLCGVEYNDGTFEQYAYNRDGLLTEARNDNSQVRILRDKQGRIIEEWQDGHKVQSLYNESGRRKKVTSSLGADLDIGYTEAGLLNNMRTEGWEMHLKHDERGLEIERVLPGGVVSRNDYDEAGRVSLHSVTSKGSEMRRMRYQWSHNDRLISMVNELTQKNTWFDYDTMGNLTGSTYNNTEKLFRVPDAVGNLYKTKERSDRKYGAGGRLLEAEDTKYHYDEEGNLAEKAKGNGERWQYKWNANSSLKEVVRPDFRKVQFEYDALGRRTAKIYDKKITRWVWDGNTPLHEWNYKLEDRPKTIKDEFGFESKDRIEPVENLITWVFEEGTFKPAAKIENDKKYSIITDYLGTPVQAYNNDGKLVWERELNIYGKIREEKGTINFVPFKYQGQYFDEEIELCYNRFRYYSPDEGMYLSQDPIRLAGENPTMYAYVRDVNSWVDEFGLDLHHIIPQAVYRDLNLKKVDGYVQNVSKKALDKTNLIDLDKPFHGNHPSYNEYVTKRIKELGDNVSNSDLKKLQEELRGEIAKAQKSGNNLNDYFKNKVKGCP